MSVGVFICSSDSRCDVLQRVLPSILKFWPDCPYRIYIGRNSECGLYQQISTVLAKPSDWRTECLEQLAQLSETHLILLLDDFLLQACVDQDKVSEFVAKAISAKLPYLRLLPLRRSLLARFVDWTRSQTQPEIRKIPAGRPFFSGLQIAVWDKAHLTLLLDQPGSIWDFEHRKIPGASHFAVTRATPFVYTHLVEKGRWLPYAKGMLKRAGLSSELGARPTWPFWMHLRLIWDQLRFHILGYANH